MMTQIARRARRNEGFTLIELLIAVLIIGILAAIALPAFNKQRAQAKNAAAQSSLRSAVVAAKTFYTQGETFAGLTNAIMNQYERSISATAPCTNAANACGPTSGANAYSAGASADPTQVLIVGHNGTDFGAVATGLRSGATFPTGTVTRIRLCAASKGDAVYCADMDEGTGTTTYAKGDTNTAAIDTLGEVAVAATGTTLGTYSATGWQIAN